jgi:F-type H+-transporting ATPase subunit a
MRRIRLWLIILGVVVITLVGFLSLRSARPIVELKAETLFRIGSFSISLGPLPLFDNGFPITNTVLTSWIVIVLLSLLCYFGTRRMELVPRGLQNFVEMIVEAFYNLVVTTAGEKHGRRFFPVVATIFFFVLHGRDPRQGGRAESRA